MTSIAIVNASVGLHDDQTVLIDRGVVVGIFDGHILPKATTTIDALGGAVLPGLWDHHVHLHASAARKRSVDVSGVRDIRDFAEVLLKAAGEVRPGEWVRVVGYNDGKLGELESRRLHELVPTEIPMRVQHRGGHQWVLNPAGARVLAEAAGREVPADGVLWEDDTLLHLLAGSRPSAAELKAEVRHLVQQGCVGATDMTATTGSEAAEALLCAAQDVLNLQLFGSPDPEGWRSKAPAWLNGAKIVISDHKLPPPEGLQNQILASRPLPVAVHAVTASALALAAWAFSGEVRVGDRIEHAFLASSGLIGELAQRGLFIGAHPGFIWSQGDRLLQQLEEDEIPDYQKLRTWHRAGTRLLGGTDMPFATENLWRAMQSAVDRRTSGGRLINAQEALSPEEAFAMFTKDGLHGRAKAPVLGLGDVADLCVIDRPWRQARKDLATVRAKATIHSGVIRWRSSGWD
ncbi:amidohydrolase family protein [Arthrobacter sp. 35W]|uniref:amidohydrolase family protein n=1 Tax=Arthrobacter sp. 35W TaxID=1132441 RepID=UPI0004797745|nr:amidohydrolase family protein [Arthrobacter sp. 35W]